MALGSKKKDKNHPPVSPEIWCQGALSWTVKVNFVCFLGHQIRHDSYHKFSFHIHFFYAGERGFW